MGMREYSRAASVLGKDLEGAPVIFLRCLGRLSSPGWGWGRAARSYALYLAGEKRKEEEIAEVQDPVP